MVGYCWIYALFDLLKVNAPDMSYYRDFLLNVIGTIESVASIESTFVMNEVKTGYGVQL